MEDNIELTEQYKVLRSEYEQTRRQKIHEGSIYAESLREKYSVANQINQRATIEARQNMTSDFRKASIADLSSVTEASSSPTKKPNGRTKSQNFSSPYKKQSSTVKRKKKGSYARFPDKEGVQRFADPELYSKIDKIEE